MSIRLKIFLMPAVVIASVTLVSFFVVESFFKTTLQDRIETELGHIATTVVESIHSLDLSAGTHLLDEVADQIGEATESRVSILDSTGRVLGDTRFSIAELDKLEGQAARPEIAAAVASGKGVSRRLSKIAGKEMFFVAVFDRHAFAGVQGHTGTAGDEHDHSAVSATAGTGHSGDDMGYIARVAMPYAHVGDAVFHQRLVFIGVGLISLVVAAAMGYYASRILVRNVEDEQRLMDQKVRARTLEISQLHTLSSLLNTCTTIEEASEVIRSTLPRLLPGLTGAIYTIKSSRNQLSLVTAWGGDWAAREIYSPSECWALRKGYKHFSYQQGIHIPCPHFGREKGQQTELPTLCIPLLAQGETLGVMHILSGASELGETDDSLAMSIAENIGLAIANLQLRENLRMQAIKDPLTGVYNRRYLTESLGQALNRAKRLESGLAVCMLDLDHFKRFNDTFGHDAGDFVLKNVARTLKNGTRECDTVSRYGGEEFCLVFPDISSDQTRLITDKLCTSVRQSDLVYKRQSLGPVTLSIGVAMYPEQGSSSEALIRRADQCLYEAKMAGRDRVVFAQREVPADPALHTGNQDVELLSPDPALHVGNQDVELLSSEPALHAGNQDVQLLSSEPALHAGNQDVQLLSPDPALHAGNQDVELLSSDPALHVGNQDVELLSSDPALHAGNQDVQLLSSEPALHAGNQDVQPLSSDPALHTGNQDVQLLSSEPALYAGNQDVQLLSPDPALHTGNQDVQPLSSDPALHAGNQDVQPLSSDPALHTGNQDVQPSPSDDEGKPGLSDSSRAS